MASEYTPNYNLDLYASEDKPNLRDQYNAAMGKIDTQLKANADGVTNVSASVVAATTAANEAKQIAQDAETAADAAAPISHASENPTYGLGTSINYGHVAVRGSIGTPSIQEDGIAASPKAVYDYAAPKSHESSDAKYGSASGSAFGHVKLTDSNTSSANVYNGTAATPTCVDNKIKAFKNQFHAQTLLAQNTIQYPNNVGSCTLSVHFDPITNICVVQYHNINLNATFSTSQNFDLYTLPQGYRPLNDCGQVCLFDLGTHAIVFSVLANGACRLSITGSSDRYNVSQIMSACITFIAEN